MLTEVELLQKCKAWESIKLLKTKKAKGCRWVYRRKEPTKKVVWPRGLVEKHGSLSKLDPMLKFKRCLDLSVTLWNMIALKGLGRGIRRRFVLLQFDGFQVKVEIVDVVTFSPIN
jgi:hypothetical protein